MRLPAPSPSPARPPPRPVPTPEQLAAIDVDGFLRRLDHNLAAIRDRSALAPLIPPAALDLALADPRFSHAPPTSQGATPPPGPSNPRRGDVVIAGLFAFTATALLSVAGIVCLLVGAILRARARVEASYTQP